MAAANTKIGFRVADDPDAKNKCWMRVDNNKYLGKLTNVAVTGRVYDPSVDLTFENGKVDSADMVKFKVVPCLAAGGRRRHRTGKRHTRRRQTRRHR
jgi:hypothetical protein